MRGKGDLFKTRPAELDSAGFKSQRAMLLLRFPVQPSLQYSSSIKRIAKVGYKTHLHPS